MCQVLGAASIDVHPQELRRRHAVAEEANRYCVSVRWAPAPSLHCPPRP
jgi:hypothetical protein